MLDELVELLEDALVEQQLDPLARGELALLVLALAALGPPPSSARRTLSRPGASRGGGQCAAAAAAGAAAAAAPAAGGRPRSRPANAKVESCFSTACRAGRAGDASPQARTYLSKSARSRGRGIRRAAWLARGLGAHLLLRLLPVVEEALEADVGQRVLEQRL